MLSQNLKQRATVPIFFCIEGYRVLLAAMPLFVVPQICNEELCSMSQNVENAGLVGILLHVATTCSFVSAYSIELYREYWCIKNLDVDANVPELNILSDDKCIAKLERINQRYAGIWAIATILFASNTIYTSHVLRGHLYESSEALITFVSFLLNVVMKLSSVSTTMYSVFMDTDRISVSAYLKKPVVYNVIESA
tara:strand:+ start:178 stop:762 length:585 start_codon:yes stop_codon:yes gene_type:complete